EHLLVGLGTQLVLVLLRQEVELVAPRDRHGLAGGVNEHKGEQCNQSLRGHWTLAPRAPLLSPPLLSTAALFFVLRFFLVLGVAFLLLTLLLLRRGLGRLLRLLLLVERRLLRRLDHRAAGAERSDVGEQRLLRLVVDHLAVHHRVLHEGLVIEQRAV